LHAVRTFLAWSETHGLALTQISPGHAGRYFDQHPGSTPTQKLHLSALRRFFDVLVERHVIVLNPALSVRTPRYSALEGKTPEITVEQARQLLRSVFPREAIDYRDRAILAVLIYTAARAGAVARLRVGDLVGEGTQFVLQFREKGGKFRAIPVRHDLQGYLEDYLLMLPPADELSPLFRAASRSGGALGERGLSGVDICRLVKRRLSAAGLPSRLSPHSFRSCTATDLLRNGVALEDVQYLLGHSDCSVTRLYDRRQKQITRNIVERISI
jgi:integrase/recombinase XerD